MLWSKGHIEPLFRYSSKNLNKSLAFLNIHCQARQYYNIIWRLTSGLDFILPSYLNGIVLLYVKQCFVKGPSVLRSDK